MADNWIPNEPETGSQPTPQVAANNIPDGENPPLGVLLDNALAIDERLYGPGKGPYSAR
ncbi:hypothetical protein ACLBKT_02525 [Erythrobacter sp. W302b]|uniref:hypothetical protein n=1 Tax=Erythrobacter sp. W302b TaxID=3389874 RepID=UPI00396B2FD5